MALIVGLLKQLPGVPVDYTQLTFLGACILVIIVLWKILTSGVKATIADMKETICKLEGHIASLETRADECETDRQNLRVELARLSREVKPLTAKAES